MAKKVLSFVVFVSFILFAQGCRFNTSATQNEIKSAQPNVSQWLPWEQNPQNKGEYAHVTGLVPNGLYSVKFVLNSVVVNPGNWVEIGVVPGIQQLDGNQFERFNSGVSAQSLCPMIKRSGFVKLDNNMVAPCAFEVTASAGGELTLLTKFGGGGSLVRGDVQFNQLGGIPSPTPGPVLTPTPNPIPQIGQSMPAPGPEETCGNFKIIYNEPALNVSLESIVVGESSSFPPGFGNVALVSFKHKFDMSDSGLKITFAAQSGSNGLALKSGKAAFGARLLKAKYKGKNVLFANSANSDGNNWTAKISGNWGRGGIVGDKHYKKFVSFGGVESAFPNQEHREFGNDVWSYSVGCESITQFGSEPRPVFRARFDGGELAGNDGFRNSFRHVNPVTVTTVMLGDAANTSATEWAQIYNSVETRMIYGNIMVPAGNVNSAANIEVIVPNESYNRVMIHSARGGTWGDLSDSGKLNDLENPMENGDKIRRGEGGYIAGFLKDTNRINSDPGKWRCPNQASGNSHVGWFLMKSSNSTASGDFEKITGNGMNYGYYNHRDSIGLLVRSPQHGFYPKFFCGPNLVHDVSVGGKLFCEMWYSPNAPTFWDGYKDYDDLIPDNGSYDGSTFVFKPIDSFPSNVQRRCF